VTAQAKILPLIIAVTAVNAAGFLLKHFELETNIILLGFRFHLSLVLPLLITFRKEYLQYIKNYFTSPEYKSAFPFTPLIFIPPVLLIGFLYLIQVIEIGDPEYFYEFGLSSIFDYPIYLIWNLPQLLMLLVTVFLYSDIPYLRKASPFVIMIFLFLFEYIPLKEAHHFTVYLSIAFTIVIISLFVIWYRNIYWIALSLFTFIWSAVLAFGSESKEIINLLFASRYTEWEGFFSSGIDIQPYLIPLYFFSVMLLLLFNILTRKLKLKT
jgi:hypothetical protein